MNETEPSKELNQMGPEEYNSFLESKYKELSLSSEQEKKLRAIIIKMEREHQIELNKDRDNTERMIQKTTKEERAELIYGINYTVPSLRIGILCNSWEISSGYFRQLRQVNEKEWRANHLYYLRSIYLENVLNAVLTDNPNQDKEVKAQIKTIVEGPA